MNVPNIAKHLRSRTEQELLQVLSRMLIRRVAARPSLVRVVGASGDLETVCRDVLGDDLFEDVAALPEDRLAPAVRALLQDASSVPEVGRTLYDAIRLSTDTVQDVLTEHPLLAGVAIVFGPRLDLSYDTGLLVVTHKSRFNAEMVVPKFIEAVRGS